MCKLHNISAWIWIIVKDGEKAGVVTARRAVNGKSSYVYCRIYPNSKIPKSVIGKDFYYAWPDGWCACVSVRKVNYREAEKMKKLSSGFYGYDWMIESILKHGAIKKDIDETRKWC